MLTVILKILSIIGIVLLVAVSILVVLLLTVLFCPVIYRINGEKDSHAMCAKIRVRWLFGLLRAGYCYPEPGRIIVKILCFPVFDSGAEKKDKKKKQNSRKKKEKRKAEKKEEHSEEAMAEQVSLPEQTEAVTEEYSKDAAGKSAQEENPDSVPKEGSALSRKIEKIKYTIQKIYGKIKHILEELGFYKELLQDQDTKDLFSHGCRRIGKVLKHIRPRKLKANITYGTGSPDTTGYLYGLYGMLSPKLGKDICIVPDFEEQVLEGSLYAAGHITVCTLLINILALLLDKRLRILFGRLKAHRMSGQE